MNSYARLNKKIRLVSIRLSVCLAVMLIFAGGIGVERIWIQCLGAMATIVLGLSLLSGKAEQ